MLDKNSIEFIQNLKVTQFSLRYTKQLMRSLISDAKRKSLNCDRKIAIIDTDDGNFWIRDGLHRCVAILMADRGLNNDEFVIEHYTYEDINSINLSVKYYTPFDLKTEVRLSDFSKFKLDIENIKQPSYTLNKEDIDGQKKKFILENGHLYKTARMPRHGSLKVFTDDLYYSGDTR